MPRRSLRNEHRDATRRSLVDAATERFAELGFSATSIDDVAESAHVTKGAVYYHFKNKREVFEAVYADQARALATRIRAAMDGADQPLSRMLAAADAFFDSTRDDTLRRLMFVEGPSVLGGIDCRRIDNEHFLGILHDVIAELQGAGLFPEVDGPLLSKLLLAVLIEASQELGTTGDPDAMRAALETIARRAVRGFGAP